MALIKWTPYSDPFEEFEKMLTEWPGYSGRQSFVPAVDLYQDNDNVYAEMPLPGVNINEVDISITNDILTVEGSKEQKTEVDDKNYYRKEVKVGSFYRSVALPASVNGDKAEAEYKNGILKVTIPKEMKVKPKKITIKSK